MLDLKYIRDNVKAVEENCKNRGVEADVGLVVELADRRSALIQESNELKQRQNQMARSIGRERDEEARMRLIEESRAMKERLPSKERELHEVEEQLRDELSKIPNMTHPDTPIGKDDTENVEIRRWREIPAFPFEPKDHVEPGQHVDEIVEERDLPLRYAGLSHCFRTEAGSHGRASRGLYRVHQFTKVEMFAFTTPEQSGDMHEEMVGIEERIFQGLGLPYRVVDICTGDLGGAAYRKYDLEAWMPGRDDFGEVTSTSNTTDYQARRLAIRYRKEGGRPQLLHTLNGTALAMSRVLISLLEIYQQQDGSVMLPEALVPYVGKAHLTPS